jgi:hypothetical protein
MESNLPLGTRVLKKEFENGGVCVQRVRRHACGSTWKRLPFASITLALDPLAAIQYGCSIADDCEELEKRITAELA